MDDNKSLMSKAWTDEVSFDRMLDIAKKVVESSLVPFKKPEDLVMAWQYGKDIGLPYSQSVNELYPIESKGVTRITAGVHVHEGIVLAKSDMTYHVLEDAVEVFHYKVRGMGTVVLSMEEVMKDIVNGKYQLLTSDDFDAEGNVLPTVQKTGQFQIIQVPHPLLGDVCNDRRTSIRFIRPSKNVDEVTTYYLHEAAAAGFLARGTWSAHLRAMMYARCFTKGSKRYASDVLKGLLETAEALVMAGREVNYAENGTVIVEAAPEDYQEVE